MISALRYEWVRLRTIRSTWWLSVITVLLAVSVSFLIALGISQAFGSEFPPPAAEVPILAQVVVSQGSAYGQFGAPFVLPYVIAIIGVFAWGHEYRHGMIRTTLTTLSSRRATWFAKYAVVGCWVTLVTLVALALCTVAGWFWLRDAGIRFATYDVWSTIAKCVVYTVIFTWVAMALASLIRNQTAALVLVLVWPLAIENLIQGLFLIIPGLREHSDITRFLPFEAGKAMLSAMDVSGPMWGDPLTPGAGFVVFAGVAGLLALASVTLFRKRDA